MVRDRTQDVGVNRDHAATLLPPEWQRPCPRPTWQVPRRATFRRPRRRWSRVRRGQDAAAPRHVLDDEARARDPVATLTDCLGQDHLSLGGSRREAGGQDHVGPFGYDGGKMLPAYTYSRPNSPLGSARPGLPPIFGGAPCQRAPPKRAPAPRRAGQTWPIGCQGHRAAAMKACERWACKVVNYQAGHRPCPEPRQQSQAPLGDAARDHVQDVAGYCLMLWPWDPRVCAGPE